MPCPDADVLSLAPSTAAFTEVAPEDSVSQVGSGASLRSTPTADRGPTSFQSTLDSLATFLPSAVATESVRASVQPGSSKALLGGMGEGGGGPLLPCTRSRLYCLATKGTG
jgi:hypothetical protein